MQFEEDLEFVFVQQNKEQGALTVQVALTPFKVYGKTIERVMKNHKEFSKLNQDVDGRKQLQNMLLHLGTNMLLTKDEATTLGKGLIMSFLASTVAIACLAVQYNNMDSLAMLKGPDRELVRDLDQGCFHYYTIRFFKKRVPCQCLMDMYCQAKAGPKLMICQGCLNSYASKLLWLCGNCKVSVGVLLCLVV